MHATIVCLVLLGLFGHVHSELTACPSGWVKNGRYCYLKVMKLQTQVEAQNNCKKLGGILAEPLSQRESDFIIKMTGSPAWYLGFNDRDSEGDFVLESSGDEICYTKWGHNQPDNWRNTEDCVEITRNIWNDVPCNARLKSVCQITLSESSLCPEGMTLFDEKCYSVSKEKASWCEAQTRCRLEGGHLVEPRSKKVNTFITRMANGVKELWIGLADMAKENSFMWDSDLQELGEFKYWAKAQPDNAANSEDCVEMRNIPGDIGTWNDGLCAVKLHYVCEMDQRDFI